VCKGCRILGRNHQGSPPQGLVLDHTPPLEPLLLVAATLAECKLDLPSEQHQQQGQLLLAFQAAAISAPAPLPLSRRYLIAGRLLLTCWRSQGGVGGSAPSTFRLMYTAVSITTPGNLFSCWLWETGWYCSHLPAALSCLY
jgi:hypothetical protein